MRIALNDINPLAVGLVPYLPHFGPLECVLRMGFISVRRPVQRHVGPVALGQFRYLVAGQQMAAGLPAHVLGALGRAFAVVLPMGIFKLATLVANFLNIIPDNDRLVLDPYNPASGQKVVLNSRLDVALGVIHVQPVLNRPFEQDSNLDPGLVLPVTVTAAYVRLGHPCEQ